MKLSLLIFFSFLFVLFLWASLFSQTLNVPSRSVNAPAGSAFAKTIWSLPRTEREDSIYAQIVGGNIPDFMRRLVPITSTATINGVPHTATYYVIPDYCAIGNDSDYFLMPMTPTLAQRVANALGCNLPTKKMVDQIYSAAAVKLAPWPIPPTDTMITVPVFYQHNLMVKSQRDSQIAAHPLGALVGGDKKDVVVTNKLYNPTYIGKVAIYGWHRLDGTPIQPLYTGHADFYADYSHGIRLVQMKIKLDDTTTTISAVLDDPALAPLLSDEGIIPNAKYPVPETNSISPTPKSVPDKCSLEQNFPNPFNPTTHLQFTIANLRFVTLRVYDILGKEIATLVSGWKSPGTYNVDFDGSMLSSGTYIYRLEASHYTMSRMMTLLK